eukprot:TRINITY_DN62962_c0_g1_i1.p1 TRINITY_DN62962_c0_g1~~TRINITY_DN62962_c0_g1_i1.p1  ORF type:complete len:747 (-),score=112.26 TRINITY_DN62962_c0_g1_i1:53-2161(-)
MAVDKPSTCTCSGRVLPHMHSTFVNASKRPWPQFQGGATSRETTFRLDAKPGTRTDDEQCRCPFCSFLPRFEVSVLDSFATVNSKLDDLLVKVSAEISELAEMVPGATDLYHHHRLSSDLACSKPHACPMLIPRSLVGCSNTTKAVHDSPCVAASTSYELHLVREDAHSNLEVGPSHDDHLSVSDIGVELADHEDAGKEAAVVLVPTEASLNHEGVETNFIPEMGRTHADGFVSAPKRNRCLDQHVRKSLGVGAMTSMPESQPTYYRGSSFMDCTATIKAAVRVSSAKRLGKTRRVLIANFAKKVVEHNFFDWVISAVLIVNAIIVGVEVDITVKRLDVSLLRAMLSSAEMFITFVFSLELILRLTSLSGEISAKIKTPTLFPALVFDASLVFVSWLDFALSLTLQSSETSGNLMFAKILTFARVFRAIRLFRLMRYLAQVRIMVVMILGSVPALFWLCVLLLCVTYVFAIALTQGAADFQASATAASEIDAVLSTFGSVFMSMYSLFKAMTGGEDWGDVAYQAFCMGWPYALIFGFFIFFTTFSVLNIVTGVFVDGAIQLADRDRATRLERDQDLKKAVIEDLRDLIGRLDCDGDGQISTNEWCEGIMNREVRASMEVLGVSCMDAKQLFTIMDTDGDGALSIEEIVDGIQRIRGPARGLHMHLVLSRVEQIAKQVIPDIRPLSESRASANFWSEGPASSA